MDYIQEELLRQQALLAWLMLGGMTGSLAEEARGAGSGGLERRGEGQQERWSGRTARDLWDIRQAEPGGAVPEAFRQQAAVPAADQDKREASDSAREQRDLSRFSGWGENSRLHRGKDFPLAGNAAALAGEGALPSAQRNRRTSLLTATAPAAAAYADLFRPVRRSAPDAGELSLAFERDARRYDGGFSWN